MMGLVDTGWRLGRRPALDGLRAVAIGLVLLTHTRTPKMGTAGSVGVTVFFALSGFLITALLLEERERAGRIDLAAFYGRRARRLLPALAVVVSVVTLVWLVWPGFVATSVLIGAVTYSTNWVYVDGHLGFGGGALAHTWSLAIEEQFYLLWPLALIACRRVPRRWMVALTAAVCVGALAWREVLYLHGASVFRLYYGTDVRADNLLLGACLAFCLHASRRRRAPGWLAPVGVGIVLVGCFVEAPAGIYVWLPTLVSVAACAVVFAAVNDGAQWLSWRPLVEVGRRSYGLYLWHVPTGVLVAHWLGPAPAVGWLVTVPVAWGLACLSWRYVEQPVQRRRSVQQVLDRELAVDPA